MYTPILSHGRVKDRVPQISRTKIEFLPEPGQVRQVRLPILAQVTAVGVDHRGRVVIKTWLIFLIQRYDQHHLCLGGQFLHPLRRRPIGDALGKTIPLRILNLAEIRAMEQLLETEHLNTLFGRFPGVLLVLLDH